MLRSAVATIPLEDPSGTTIAAKKQQQQEPPGRAPTPTTKSTANHGGQLEDADHGGKEKETSSSTTTNKSALEWLAAACDQEHEAATSRGAKAVLQDCTITNTPAPALPLPSRLQRRISTNTSDATRALLEIARSSSFAPPHSSEDEKKEEDALSNEPPQKTFAMRVEQIKRYKSLHGRLDCRQPIMDEAWERDLWTWLAECRSLFRSGSFCEEQASILNELGCEGFSTVASDHIYNNKNSINATETEAIRGTMRSRSFHSHSDMGQLDRQQELFAPAEGLSYPAMRALMLQRQEETRLAQLRSAGLFPPAGLANMTARADPDGTHSIDTDHYPTSGRKPENRREGHPAGGNAYSSNVNVPISSNFYNGTREGSVGAGFALQEIYRREAFARDAFAREQRMAAAMGIPFGHRLTSSILHHGGRVMPLLQPLESVPPRADGLMHLRGGPYGDPRMNALLQAQLAVHRRPSDTCARRNSDVSMSLYQTQTRRPSDLGSSMSISERRASDAAMSYDRRASDASSTAFSESHKAGTADENNGAHRSRKSWDERIKEMRRFFLTYGHIQVLTRGKHKELGRWLSNVRCKIRQGALPEHQIKDVLAMREWKMDREAIKEARALALTTEAALEYPPVEDGSVCTAPESRRISVTGASSSVVAPVAEMQEDPEISPQSSTANNLKRAMPKSWNQSFEDLIAFKQRFGHCDVKMIVNSPYSLLGKWLASQRSRHKLGQLPAEKVWQLRELGCTGFADLPQGANSTETAQPYRSLYRSDDEEAEFDAAIRRLKAASERKSGEVDISQALPDSASTTPANSMPPSPACAKREKRVRHSYEARVDHIKAFKAKHGHCKIRLGSTDKHEELLARWLASARSRYRAGQFREDRAAELREVGCDGFEPFTCTPGAASNSSMELEKETVAAVATTKKRGKPARTATPSPTPILGRSEEEESNEQQEKKPRISKDPSKRQSFEDMLQELVAYQYCFGAGCSVPKPDGDGGKLGRWLAFQRRQFLAGKLATDRIEKLRAIGRKEFSETDLVVRAAERAAAICNDQ